MYDLKKKNPEISLWWPLWKTGSVSTLSAFVRKLCAMGLISYKLFSSSLSIYLKIKHPCHCWVIWGFFPTTFQKYERNWSFLEGSVLFFRPSDGEVAAGQHGQVTCPGRLPSSCPMAATTLMRGKVQQRGWVEWWNGWKWEINVK